MKDVLDFLVVSPEISLAIVGVIIFVTLVLIYIFRPEFGKATIDGKEGRLNASPFVILIFVSLLLMAAPLINKIFIPATPRATYPEPPEDPVKNVTKEINLAGKYIYQSSPIPVGGGKQSLLVNEKGDRFYQFAGTVEIKEEILSTGKRIYSVCGQRQYHVRLKEEKVAEITKLDPKVQWIVRNQDVYLPQPGQDQSIIFILNTKDNFNDHAPNLGIYVARAEVEPTEKLEKGETKLVAKKIDGHMYYLNHLKNTLTKENPTWTKAYMSLQRVKDFDYRNTYLLDSDMKILFEKFGMKGIEIIREGEKKNIKSESTEIYPQCIWD